MDSNLKTAIGVIVLGVLAIILIATTLFIIEPYLYESFIIEPSYFKDILIITTTVAAYLFIGYKICIFSFEQPLYTFIPVSFFVFLICVMLFFNRGWYLLYISVIHSLPAFTVALIICTTLLKKYLKNHPKSLYLTLLYVIIVGGYSEYQATNWAEFENERYAIEVNTYTIPTFLDWQIEAQIEIEDKILDRFQQFDFSYGNGPYFNLYANKIDPEKFYIIGTRYNGGVNWMIDINKEILNYASSNFDSSQFHLLATHDSDFELKLPVN